MGSSDHRSFSEISSGARDPYGNQSHWVELKVPWRDLYRQSPSASSGSGIQRNGRMAGWPDGPMIRSPDHPIHRSPDTSVTFGLIPEPSPASLVTSQSKSPTGCINTTIPYRTATP